MFQFLTTAESTTQPVSVFHATRDTTSLTDNASSLHQTMPSHQISDVNSGTGTTKYASNAQEDSPSTPSESVFKFLITAKTSTLLETVFHVIKVMNLLMDNAKLLIHYVRQLIKMVLALHASMATFCINIIAHHYLN